MKSYSLLKIFCLLIALKAWGLNYTITEGRKTDFWMDYSEHSKVNVSHLFELLQNSSEGKKLLNLAEIKARSKNHELIDLVLPGDGSITDTTLVRRFLPENPEKMEIEWESKVYINRHLSFKDAILDLAHELRHFVSRHTFNPYQDNYDLVGFIKSTIEGEGGEVDAYVTECKVLSQLYSKSVYENSTCKELDTSLSKEEQFKIAKQLFYQMGDYKDQMVSLLDKHKVLDSFAQLSGAKIKFVSSAYGIPYPLAAFYEYQTVLNKVCENDRKRLVYLQQDKKRSPASIENLTEKLNKRCRLITFQN
jgi:hypothetical protein